MNLNLYVVDGDGFATGRSTQELRITDQKDAKTDAHQLVCGDGDSSVLQPAWHASGALFYLTDEQGFYALQRFEGGASKTVLSVADADLGGSAPGWSFGQQGYTFLADGRVAAAYPDRQTGQTAVAIFDEDGSSKNISPVLKWPAAFRRRPHAGHEEGRDLHDWGRS